MGIWIGKNASIIKGDNRIAYDDDVNLTYLYSWYYVVEKLCKEASNECQGKYK